jgi:hypothetical protein
MSPKYFVTFSFAVARSMSPASTSTALLGPYQVRNQVLTSSSDAALRSFIEPMVLWWYGWPSGYSALRAQHVPDLAVGLVLALALLVLDHAALLVEHGFWSMAPSRWPMRSDSIHSAMSSAVVGTFWK